MKITATGIKTGGFSLELAPLTIITGDNGSGKTAIADAFRLGFLGYHPTLGSRNGEILKLANGNTLEVEIDGRRRTWTRKGAGGSCEENDAAKEFDRTKSFSPVVLDFESFLQAKATARREILEAVLPTIDGEKIADEIDRKLSELDLSLGMVGTPCDFVDLVKRLGELGREWKQEAERLKGAIQSLEVDLAEEATVVDFTGDLSELSARRDKILAEQGEHSAAVVDLSERLKNQVEKPSEKKPTKKELTAAKRSIENAAKAKSANEAIRLQIGKVRSLPEPEAVTSLRSELNDLREEISAIGESWKITNSRVEDLKDRKDRLSSCQACPTCGTSGIEFLTSVADLIDNPLKDLKGGLAKLTRQLDDLKTEREVVEKKIAILVEEHNESKESAVAALEAEIDYDAEIPVDDPNRLERLLVKWERFKASKPVSDEERANLEARGTALAHNLADLDGQIAAAKRTERFKQDLARRSGDLVRLKDELETAKKSIKSIKAAGDWAKARSLEVAAERLNPLLDPANSILSGVVEGSLAIEGTEIGLRQGENFRPIEVLSGAEATAVAAAIQVALASVGDVKVVIVDELSRLTWDRRRSLVGNLLSAVKSNLIDHVIAIDHDEDNWEEDCGEISPDVSFYKVA